MLKNRILIVDDEPDIAQVLKMGLRIMDWGCDSGCPVAKTYYFRINIKISGV
jgi:DNA-binding NtrC family response regulator